MTPGQIKSTVKAGESETLEFKKTTGERRAAAQTICGMLNCRGGRVLFGVTPKHEILGQQVSDHTIEEVAQEIKEIDPPVFPNIDRTDIGRGKEVLTVTVTQGHCRPYSYKGQAYKRVGNTTQEMSRDEYNRLLLERLHGEERWENRTVDDWAMRDLDTAQITRTIEEAIRRGRMNDPGTRDPRLLLQGLGLLNDRKILRAAAVLFGDPDRLEVTFPQCTLRVARFKGTDKTEFLDNRQFHGNAFDLLILAERFLRENLPVAGRVVPNVFERKDDPLYPPVALREALANAFCHRDYSIGGGSVAVAIYDDRLEITSSGTLHFGLTVDALFQPHESLPWNPLMARVFYRRGIIESWGRGTLKMAELTEQAGLPRPQIEEVGGCVTVRFRLHPEGRIRSDVRLSKQQQRILQLIRRNEPVALRELKEQLPKVPEWMIKEDMASLKELGLIESTGRGRGAVWHATEE